MLRPARGIYGGGMFYWRSSPGPVEAAITDRAGGVSRAPYDTLNLGRHVGDEPAAVEENRRRLAEALRLTSDRLVFMDQCHGREVAVVTDRGEPPPAVDGLVTRSMGLALVAMVADCAPLLLWDEANGVIGAAHAGRVGMVAGIVAATVEAMRDLGADTLRAVIGPTVCGLCYEVPAEVRESAAAAVPQSRTLSRAGTAAIDVAAGVAAQLRALGVSPERVPGCTREDPRLYSHRRSGVTGRLGGVIVRRSP